MTAQREAEAQAAERERIEGEERGRLRQKQKAEAEKKERRESALKRAKLGGFEMTLSILFPPFGMGGAMSALFSVLPYTFFDIGLDAGALFDDGEVYLYPYAHVNLYLPVGEHLGLYAGAGAGYMLGLLYGYHAGALFDAAAGFYLGGDGIYFKLGYSLRTPVEQFFIVTSSGISAGLSLHFND
jgi:hypothetical protein